MKTLKKEIKKILAGILTATCVFSFSSPVMADNAKPQVLVQFICGGNSTGKYVDAGSNVTAPAAPVISGFTFCGYDKSLYNITQNTVINAVYESDAHGKDAIKAKKASLPTPAISATTVADPNAVPNLDSASALALAQSVANAAANPNTQQAALSALLQAQKAASAVANSSDAKAAANAAASAVAGAQPTAAQIAAAQAAANQVAQAVQPAAAQAVQAAQAAVQPAAAAATGVPSWCVSLHGVSAADCAKIYNYWKTVKNFDDSYIKAYWDPLLYHYSGHGMAGW